MWGADGSTNSPVIDDPPAIEVEHQTPAGNVEHQKPAGTGILRRGKREDLIKRGCLALRGLALLFSLLAFIIMASNRHGEGRDFDDYDEYRYVLAIAILSTLYTAGQTFRQIYELSAGTQLFPRRNLAFVDFFGDQITAYLLVSAASSAVPLTNRFRKGADDRFTDSSAAAVSMEFLAFFALALSALISGYKLSTQSYI
ncbi:CASP-like protein 4B1 [Diospyros lotus]|uniref:CASP-like protein 4B1 n=1 Tax=Diospyros lotus TaxID=55363 RepID=UPI002254BB95|nr:CASP-like protein 4B1 [Diospyros lotus]